MQLCYLAIIVLLIVGFVTDIANCHVCLLKKRIDPSDENALKWSLPSEERYLCQKVVAVHLLYFQLHFPDIICSGIPNLENVSELWFIEDPSLLTFKNNMKLQHERDVIEELLGIGNTNDIRSTNTTCTLPLGIESGSIKDHQINQSSYFGVFTGYRARLNHESHWRPLDEDKTPWLRINLLRLHHVTGIVTQGRIGDDNKKRWVKHLYVLYANDTTGLDFVYLKDVDGNNKVFAANTDPNTTVPIFFDDPIETIAIQIQLLRGTGECYFDWHCLLRLEILGCQK